MKWKSRTRSLSSPKNSQRKEISAPNMDPDHTSFLKLLPFHLSTKASA
jgi:hypothetical protein